MTGQFVGTVTNYDPRLHIAVVRLADVMRLGDRVTIRDSNGGLRMAIDHLECGQSERRLVEAGQDVQIRVPRAVEIDSLVEMDLEAPWP